jgi:hypothetical protein
MCLFSTVKYPAIAEKDIIAYKALLKEDDKSASAIYQSYKYTFDTLYTNEEPPSVNYEPCIDLYIIGKGFYHSFKRKKSAEALRAAAPIHRKVYKVTIPKGSLYYEGSDGDICSNQIIIHKAR